MDRPRLARVEKISGELDNWAPVIDTEDDFINSIGSDGKYLYVAGHLLHLSPDRNNPFVLVRYDLSSGTPVLDLSWGTFPLSVPFELYKDEYIYFKNSSKSLGRLNIVTGDKDNWDPVFAGILNYLPTSSWVYTSVTSGSDDPLLNVIRLDTQTRTSLEDYLDPVFKLSKQNNQSQFQVMAADGAEVYVATGNDYVCIARNEKHCGFKRYIVDPPVPLPLDAFDLIGTGFTAFWESIYGVDQYVVELTSAADNFAPNTFIAADGTRGQAQGVTVSGWTSHSLVFSGLDPNTTYVYRLQASNSVGSSNWSKMIRQSPSWYNTYVSLDITPSLSKQGKLVTLTATLSTTGNLPGGTVTFKNGTNVVGTAEVNADGEAVLRTGSLPVGQNMITAEYSGAAGFLPSISVPVKQTVISWFYENFPLIGR